MDSPETWRWIWAVAAFIFLMGELAAPATFFFLPFAVGAAFASLAAFLGVNTEISWAVFLVISAIAFSTLWRLGRRLEQADDEQEGIGATRWVGQEARVVEDIPADGIGWVRLERENWRAESLTGEPIDRDSTVIIARMAGTRLVVVPTGTPHPPFPEASQGAQ